MTQTTINGKITFIHHDKNRAVIEYLLNDKKKTIQANIDPTVKTATKHRYLVGDQVSFTIKKTGSNGSVQYAEDLKYLYNTALEILINKALVENKFLGYIKVTDDDYFIKEIESYLFFPLTVSRYEIPPREADGADPVFFRLDNIEKPDKITASLYNHDYIPGYLKAVQHAKKQLVAEATVYNITPFGIYLDLFDHMVKAKLVPGEVLSKKISENEITVGSVIPVKIKHISPDKLVVELANEEETKNEN